MTEMHPRTIFNFSFKTITGKDVNMSDYKGRKAYLIVNTASQSRFFDAYMKALCYIYSLYSQDGLEIMAFPTNQFKLQPLTNTEIKKSMVDKYNLKFPVFAKLSLHGEQHPFFSMLSRRSILYNLMTGESEGIQGSFSKWLCDSQGYVVRYYEPFVDPRDICPDIEQLLYEQ